MSSWTLPLTRPPPTPLPLVLGIIQRPLRSGWPSAVFGVGFAANAFTSSIGCPGFGLSSRLCALTLKAGVNTIAKTTALVTLLARNAFMDILLLFPLIQ